MAFHIRRRWLVPVGLLAALGILLGLPGAVGTELRGFGLNRAVLGILVAAAGAAVIAGTIAGGVALGVARAFDFAFEPPRWLAAWVFRRSPGTVTRAQVLAVHFGGGVLALTIVGVTGYLAAIAGGVALGGSGPSLLRSGPVVGVGLLLSLGFVAWLTFAYQWLPAQAGRLDRTVTAVRRESLIVVVVYGVVAGIVFPTLLFLTSMAVFFR